MQKRSGRIARDFDLASMDRSQLESLLAEVERQLEVRQFEENLRRQLETHMRRRGPDSAR